MHNFIVNRLRFWTLMGILSFLTLVGFAVFFGIQKGRNVEVFVNVIFFAKFTVIFSLIAVIYVELKGRNII